jgi:hypothetical protein
MNLTTIGQGLFITLVGGYLFEVARRRFQRDQWIIRADGSTEEREKWVWEFWR